MNSPIWHIPLTILALIPFYLMGAYPTGYLIAKSRNFDILHFGSGNIGATNISRALGARAGLFTLLGDIAKGLLATCLASWLWSNNVFVASAAVTTVAGHCFSIPGKLQGGKGVATSLGVLLVLEPLAAIVALLIFCLSLITTRIVSISSILAAFAAPTVGFFLGTPEASTIAMSTIAAIIVYRHRSNIKRLILGVERKFSFNRNEAGR